ncbi:peroxin_13_-_putative [Leishmania major strain Friedlin]|nr:peroxin_13_-_putative [Leishmania major strain Friedlin]
MFSGMYGGGLGGMGSAMYGGGLGGMGGMYGGGLGGMSGMYGNSGLMGGSSYAMSGGLNSFVRNNPYGSNSNYSVGGFNSLGSNADGTQNNGMQSSINLQQQADQSNHLASPIHQHAATLPPLNESPEERSRRIQAEHKKERQLIRQQREQHRQARLQARMEIVGHLTNVLVQGLRSAMELFGVCFGTYYSMKAVRAFSSAQERMPSMGMGMGANYPYGAAVAKTQAVATGASGVQQVAKAASGGSSKWRAWLLCIAFFLLGEVVYGIATRQRAKLPQRRRRITGPAEDAYGNVLSQDEYEVSIRSSDAESRLTEGDKGEEETLSEAWGQAYNANGVCGVSQAARPSGGNGTRRVYYALYDYQAPQADGSCLSFKAGDEFVVENYAEGSWCEAMAVEGGSYSSHGRRGLVPSNFLRLAERITKL